MDLYDMLGDVGGGFRRADKSRTRLTLNNMKDNPFGGLMEEIAYRPPQLVGLGAPITADFAIDRMRDAKTQLEQARAAARVNAARERLAMDRAKSRAMTGTYQNPELTRLGNAEQIAAAMERARGGAAPGQQIDPRWLLGGISVSGQGLTRGGGAAPAPASMGREALAARLAQMAGARYRDGTVMPTSGTRVEVRPDGRIALIGRAGANPERAMPEEGVPTVRDRLMAARARRAADNAPRMLTSRNPAVREKGQALLDTMRGPQQAIAGVDIAAITREATMMANKYGPAVGQWYANSKMAEVMAKAEAAARATEHDKTLASNEKIARERAEADLKLATDPRVVLMQGLNKDLTPQQAMERVRLVESLSGAGGVGAGVATPVRPSGPVVPRPFESAGGPPIPVAPPVVMPPIRPGGRVIDEEYKRGSYTGSLGDAWNPYARR